MDKVVGVDLKRLSIALPENAHFVEGDSIEKQTSATISALAQGKRLMVIADGNHAADHVLQEMRLYGPLVSVGCYFIAENGDR